MTKHFVALSGELWCPLLKHTNIEKTIEKTRRCALLYSYRLNGEAQVAPFLL